MPDTSPGTLGTDDKCCLNQFALGSGRYAYAYLPGAYEYSVQLSSCHESGMATTDCSISKVGGEKAIGS